MKEKKSKNWIRYILLGVTFIVILAGALFVTLFKTTSDGEEYRQMEKASLPLISVTCGDWETNLHGYVNKMDTLDMRDVIVPLTEKRTLDFKVYAYENQLLTLNYEVRSLNNELFIDGGVIELTGSGAYQSLSVQFSALLESGTEYQLVLELHTDDSTVYYYSRMMYAKTEYFAELLQFAKDFSDAEYIAEKGQFIVNYIQPDESVAENNYFYANLHSKYAILTFQDLDVERTDEALIRISELEPTQMTLQLKYQIRIDFPDSSVNCDVTEYFCVRYRNEKVYLLDYYREIEQIFEPENATRENGRILLGIGDGETEVLNSDNHVYTAFVRNRELWSYNSKTNAMSLVFSFTDEQDGSGRSSFDHHDVLAVKVSDSGDIDYMVYGYMNRGPYEGQVGICFYRYRASENATERLFYMPVEQSELMILMDIGTLAYVNDNDVCYVRYGDGIYSIDLTSGESVEVSIRAYPGMYAKNELGNVVAWQEGDDYTYPDRLVILNMDTQTTVVVNADSGMYVKLLDFLGDDIIYGFGSRGDSVISANVDMQQLIKHIFIVSADEGLTVRQEYTTEDYIIDASAKDSRIVIDCCKKDGEGNISNEYKDYLLLTQDITRDQNRSTVTSRVSTNRKREYYIQIGTTTNSDSQFSTVIPRFGVSKSVHELKLLYDQTDAYYVYGYGTLLYVESSINVAIEEAYDVFGVVMDSSMNCLWNRGTRELVKTISIQPYRAAAEARTLETALSILCAEEGIQLRGAEKALGQGTSPFDIIDNALGKKCSLNLYGCSLQQVLYFINEGHPVIGVTGDREAVVITGYDQESVMVYDPFTGITTAMKLKDATAFFEAHANAFISYR